MLLNELFEVSRDLVGRYKTAAIKDVDRAIAAKAAGTMGRDEYERKMTKRGRGTAAAQRRLTPQGTRLDLTPYGDAIQRDYDRYRTDEQGVAEGWKDKVAGAALAGSMAMGGAPAHAGFAGDLAQSAARGLGAGVVAGAAGPSIFKKKNAADLAFAEQIPDAEAKAKFLKAAEYMRNSRNMSLSDPSMMGSNAVDEARFKKIKHQLSSKYNIQQGVEEGVSLKQKHEDKKRADQNQVRYGKMTQAEFDKKWTRTERPNPTDKKQGVAEGRTK
jgi:hypothetical protein